MKFEINPRLLEKGNLQPCNFRACQAACCRYGVWADLIEAKEILANSALILPFVDRARIDPSEWFETNPEDEPFSASGQVLASKTVPDPTHPSGSACVFLRKDWRCSLQLAAESAGLHPWKFKPFYCILHPLDLDKNGIITLPDSTLILKEFGSCLEKSDHPEFIIKIFQPELEYLLGKDKFSKLLDRIKK